MNLQDFVGQISVAHQALRKRTCQQFENTEKIYLFYRP
ncbi:hypothetical protein AB85_0893 [Escherichia coli 2-156-04_S3_C1]|nr:hypothetical protein AB85_0893 [Escherichia coli 2-156-04_S3_C1]